MPTPSSPIARLLEHLAIDADGVQAERCRKSANTPSND